ncbi:MAG: hypothetical protein EU536_00050 [Promethearchaeota archaeon]|nr:MAG: hypothetical protein EU536_00050 [Candidatus Lokiarchaeota archaeon]
MGLIRKSKNPESKKIDGVPVEKLSANPTPHPLVKSAKIDGVPVEKRSANPTPHPSKSVKIDGVPVEKNKKGTKSN